MVIELARDSLLWVHRQCKFLLQGRRVSSGSLDSDCWSLEWFVLVQHVIAWWDVLCKNQSIHSAHFPTSGGTAVCHFCERLIIINLSRFILLAWIPNDRRFLWFVSSLSLFFEKVIVFQLLWLCMLCDVQGLEFFVPWGTPGFSTTTTSTHFLVWITNHSRRQFCLHRAKRKLLSTVLLSHNYPCEGLRDFRFPDWIC